MAFKLSVDSLVDCTRETEREQFEQTLQEKNTELENAQLAEDRFLGSMSHELRTPLNAIIGFTGTLLMQLPGPLTEEQRKQPETIRSSAKHLFSLISDLLDLAKIQSGKVALAIEPVALQSMVGKVCSTLRPLAEVKGLKVNVTVPEGEMVINTDRRVLSEILLNLTNNPIKLSEQGEVRVVLSREELDGMSWNQLSVHDTAIGIPPEQRNPHRYEGTGLGLHLSKKLAELLGAQITFKSDYDNGSSFTLSFPEEIRVRQFASEAS
jgi:signal transduction histidine kinase